MRDDTSLFKNNIFPTVPIASNYKEVREKFAYKVLLFAKCSLMHYY